MIELYATSSDGTSVNKITTSTPFFSHGNPVADYEAPDMEPEDGWVLVHRDFGIAGDAQAFPFFTLYNKYRSIFRIMLYNAANREGSYFLGELSFLDGKNYQAAWSGAFTFADNKVSQCSLKEYDPEVKLTAMSQMVANASWAVFDYYLLGFDPDFAAKDPILIFRLISVEKQSIKLQTAGNIQLFQSMNDQHSARPGFTSAGASTFQTGSGLVEVGKKGFATYKSVSSFFQNEILSPAAQEKHKDASWYGAVKSLAGSKLGSFVPYVAAFSSVLECFVGGANTASAWEPINFKGHLELDTDGTLQSSRDLWCHCFYMKAGTPDGAKAHRPLREVPWGLFNFKEMPIIRETIVTKVNRYNLGDYDFTTKLFALPQIVYNSGSGMTLTSVKVAFVVGDERFSEHMRGPKSRYVASPFMSPQAALDTGYTYFAPTGYSPDQFNKSMVHPDGRITFSPCALLWEFKFKIQQPIKRSDQEIVVYKRTAMRDKGNEDQQARFKAMREANPGAQRCKVQ